VDAYGGLVSFNGQTGVNSITIDGVNGILYATGTQGIGYFNELNINDLQANNGYFENIYVDQNIYVSSGASIIAETGDTLSRRYILQAGLIDHSKVLNQNDSIFTLREGLGPNGAYGLGGTKEFG
jgi:hypothetical protein